MPQIILKYVEKVLTRTVRDYGHGKVEGPDRKIGPDEEIMEGSLQK